MTSKQIFCPIHGFISISPLMKSIIDTSEFKRLHHLRQLGAAYLIFPSANHTRFEHSIGVSHLAGRLIKNLQTKQPDLNITDRIIELIQVAALVHDIGHGPFSHLYDDIVAKLGKPHHEERGIQIFQNLVTRYKIQLKPREVDMIIKMINPTEDCKHNYLYQIVANKVCSVDVDKIDYIQRDSYHLGLSQNINYDRIITMCKVVMFNGTLQLAWPEKLQHDILMLFETRYRLHKNVYYHHAVKSAEFIIETMLINILNHSENKDILDMSNDMIIYMHPNFNLIPLKRQLDMRQFPKMIGEKVMNYTNTDENNENIGIFEKKLDTIISKLNQSEIKNMNWCRFTIGFISGNGENPLKNVIYFKHKTNPTGFTLDHYSSFMEPKNYKEYIYRIYICNKKNFKDAEQMWISTI
jgi:HD superfamily phosphohydrolase